MFPPNGSNQDGRVGVSEWFAFIAAVKQRRGDEALENFLDFIEAKVLEEFPDIVLREPEMDPDEADDEAVEPEDPPEVKAEKAIR